MRWTLIQCNPLCATQFFKQNLPEIFMTLIPATYIHLNYETVAMKQLKNTIMPFLQVYSFGKTKTGKLGRTKESDQWFKLIAHNPCKTINLKEKIHNAT